MDKLHRTGQNMDRVVNSRSGYVPATQLPFFEMKLPNLKLRIGPKQNLGSLPLGPFLDASLKFPSLNALCVSSDKIILPLLKVL